MDHPFEYEIIYSSRKTIAIQVTRDGHVLVRSPKLCSRSYIDAFVSHNEKWVLKHLGLVKELEEQKRLPLPYIRHSPQKTAAATLKLPETSLHTRQNITRESWASPMAASPSGSRKHAGEAAAAKAT